MVEIFHSFNMRSRRASIFAMKTQNKWLWGAAVLALVLTVIPVEVDFLAEVFGFMTLDPMALLAALGLAFLIIRSWSLQGRYAQHREKQGVREGTEA